jgi:MOSC domain-containing protein YiiM
MGENVTTRGLDLLALPEGKLLRLGDAAVVRVTGLRNPCGQLNGLRAGLRDAVLATDDEGNVVHKSGVMAVVLESGEVRPGDPIEVERPPPPHRRLEVV